MFFIEFINSEFIIDFLRFWLVFASIYYLSISIVYISLLLLSLRVIIKSKKTKKQINKKQILTDKTKSIPSISIIIPAYNEEVSVIDTLSNSLKNQYPSYELILVNDGSKDNTLKKIIDYSDLEELNIAIDYNDVLLRSIVINKVYKSKKYPNLLVIDKENGGKASALNTGIYFAQHDYICAVDADTIIKKDALQKTISPFLEKPNTIAVGAILRVGNGLVDEKGEQLNKNMNFDLLPLLQTIEYERDFKLGRLGWYSLKSTILISGAFGVFKKDVVKAIGGYNLASIGEDLELLMRIHNVYGKKYKEKYEVVFIPEEVCYTESPSSYSILYNQRNRWHRGLMDSLTINNDVLFSPDHGKVGMLTVPYYFLAELYGPVIKYLNYFMIFLAILTGIVSIKIFTLIIIISFLFRVVINMATLLLDNLYFNDNPRIVNFLYLFIASFIDGIGYKQFVSMATLGGFIDYYNSIQGWGKMERKGMQNTKKKG